MPFSQTGCEQGSGAFLHALQDFGQQLLIVLEYAEGDMQKRLAYRGPMCKPGSELSEKDLEYIMYFWIQMLKVRTSSIVVPSDRHHLCKPACWWAPGSLRPQICSRAAILDVAVCRSAL